MDDLIRRQDAVDALQKEINKVIPPFDDVMGSIRCGIRLSRNIIEDLPSAQQWIPCSERLPEKSGKYLVSCKANAYSNITTAAHWQSRYKHWDMTGARSHWRVDAWMPLPEPYKGEE